MATENQQAKIIDVIEVKSVMCLYKTQTNIVKSNKRHAKVWIADLPEHMIHLNGDKFLGLR